MNAFKITILGSGSAIATQERFSSAQLIEVHNKQFLVDCGEGTQIRLKQLKGKCTRLKHIFISHLHGDHCFGLIGLISSLGLMKHTSNIEIHSAPELEQLLQPSIDFFCQESPFKVIFHPFNPRKSECIYEDRSLTVTTIPLKHRVPTCGFIFEEKTKERHLIKEMLDKFDIPIRQRKAIKEGADFVTSEGIVIANNRLTREADKAKKYAYCSDTAYSEKIIPFIQNADCLYHEATFEQAELIRARQTQHSTAQQAALIAKTANAQQLIIGHFSARYKTTDTLLKEAQNVFKPTTCAFDGAVFAF